MPDADRPRSFLLRLDDEAATARLGSALARVLRPGDMVLLIGALGAGKSALARSVIGALLGDPDAEIPSPSYTLINIYETPGGPVWHADLYRLSGDASEIAELGLDEAMTAPANGPLVLVEWPERLGGALPARRIEIRLSARAGSEGRDAVLTLVGSGWEAAVALLSAWT